MFCKGARLAVIYVVGLACMMYGYGNDIHEPVRTTLTRSFLDVYMRAMSPYDKIRWALVKNIARANNMASFVSPQETLSASPLWVATVSQQTFSALTQGVPCDCRYEERIIELIDGDRAIEKSAFCSVADATGMVEPKCYTVYEYLPLDSCGAGK